jgi:TRAP-type mannitol/chloroaromatic compound transport system permease small subunit
MKALVKAIDKLNSRQGQLLSWLSVVLVLIMTFEVIMRYLFNRPTMWSYDMVIMVGCAMYAFAWPYVQKLNSHIRVDILYSRLSERGKAFMDVICSVFLFFPLLSALCYAAFIFMLNAWVMNEKSSESYWYPPIAPLRTLFFIGLVLLELQGIAQLIKDIRVLVRRPTS